MDESPSSDECLRRRQRIARTRDIEAVFRGRASSAGHRIVVYGIRNSLGYNRLGLVVSRRLAGAVVRHRFKRLVREAFRRTKPRQPQGWDWLVLPRLPKKGRREQSAGNCRSDETRPSEPWRLDDFKQELITLMRKVASRPTRHRGRDDESRRG